MSIAVTLTAFSYGGLQQMMRPETLVQCMRFRGCWLVIEMKKVVERKS